MNRYTYKAKRKDNGEWVYGYYYKIWDEHYLLWGMINNNPIMEKIIPETLCQCTGMIDKNGNVIYEKDNVMSFEGIVYTVMYVPTGYWCIDGNGNRNGEMLSENLNDGSVWKIEGKVDEVKE